MRISTLLAFRPDSQPADVTPSLLNELDTDLLQELDEKVKDNQRQTLKYARSDAALAKLLERLPDLSAAIERDKQAKIDNIMMQAKYFEGDSRTSTSVKAGSADELQLPSLPSYSRRKSSRAARSTISPEIEGKMPSSDMLFDMEDEDIMLPEASNKDELNTRGKARADKTHRVSSPPLESHRGVWYDSKGKPLSTSQDINISSVSPSVSPTLNKTASPVNLPESPTPTPQGAPWGMQALPSSKLGLKEIMAQASAGRTSNISLGLSSQSKQPSHDRATAQPGSKISQRDRKKMQHAQQPSEPLTPETTDIPIVEAKSSAPWQTATRGPKVTLKDVIGEDSEAHSSKPATASTSRNISAPVLTMRQTIANPAAAAGSSRDAKNQLANPSPQQRSTSTPQAPTRQSSNLSNALQNSKSPAPRSSPTPTSAPFTSSPSTQPPTIRSISHMPNPLSTAAKAAEPSLGLSMADIVSQQQAEKDTVREVTTAKRSLQDIQQEQEFQEWWDKESRKVQGIVEGEEEEAAREDSGRRESARGKGGRGRGGGKGRRAESSRGNGGNEAEGSQATAEKGGEKRRQNRRGRGGGKRVASGDQHREQ